MHPMEVPLMEALRMLNVPAILIVTMEIPARTMYVTMATAKVAPIIIPAMMAMPVRRAIHVLEAHALLASRRIAMTVTPALMTAAPLVNAFIVQ